MSIVLVTLVVVLLVGGGGIGLGWHSGAPSIYGGGLGIIVLVLLAVLLFGR